MIQSPSRAQVRSPFLRVLALRVAVAIGAWVALGCPLHGEGLAWSGFVLGAILFGSVFFWGTIGAGAALGFLMATRWDGLGSLWLLALALLCMSLALESDK